MMDIIGWYILCVTIVILFLGLLGYMWLQLVEYQIATMRLNRPQQNLVPQQNWIYQTDGHEVDPTGYVERYMVTVAGTENAIHNGNNAEEEA